MARDVARRDELAGNLKAVRERIEAACAAAGRSPAEVTLIAITKTFPASDVALLASLGLAEVGENRDQEAAPKAAECAAFGVALHWHFVGQLQVNKVASVTAYADVVHSVDRMRLVRALGSHAEAPRTPAHLPDPGQSRRGRGCWRRRYPGWWRCPGWCAAC